MYPRRVSTVGLVSLAALSISVEARGSFVGVEVPPTPHGCSHRESMVLGPSDAFAYERMVCNGIEIVFLQQFTERRGKLAYWKVIDELHLPPGSLQRTALEVPLCSSNAHPYGSILAVGRWTKRKDGAFVATDISHAWRFNLAEGKIEAISTRGVYCEGDDPD